ncbi:MAG: sigma-70 family RNA polymerase sigma factor [Planctomycetota bacterium]
MDRAPLPPDDLILHTEALRALARGILGDAHRAEDVVQDAFLAAIEGETETVRSLPRWLSRVTRNLALNVRRSEQHRRLREQRGSRQEAVGSHGDASSELALRELVTRAIDDLPEPYRTAIQLRYVEELQPRHIAARLDVPLNTVKARLRRALDMLRRSLDERSDGDRQRWQVGMAAFLGRRKPAVGAPAVLIVGAVAVSIAVVLSVAWWSSKPSVPRPAETAVSRGPAAERSVDVAPPAARSAAEPSRRAVDVSTPEGAEERGTLVVRVLWPDDTPAAGVWLSLHPRATRPLGVVELRTGDDGTVRAELPAGAVEVASDRGGLWGATVKAAAIEKAQFRLHRGVTVEGVVLDGFDRPVAGAGIWLTAPRSDWLAGRIVAASGADGAFRVRAVDPEMSLGARAAGFAPAELLDLSFEDTSTSPVRVRLRLDTPGGALRGTVRDPNGAPLPSARVAVGEFQSMVSARAGGSFIEHLTPTSVETDADGRFACDGLPTGEVPIFVWADGFPVLRSAARVDAGETREVELVLAAAATVHGVVRDGHGRPVAGAAVASVAPAFHGVYLDPAGCPNDQPYPRAVARTDSDGRYALSWVQPGSAHLVAWDGARSALDLAALAVEAGAHVRWDPVVAVRPAIRGRVVDAYGQAIETTVYATATEGERIRRVVDTDDQGRFVVPRCDDRDYGLVVESEIHFAHPNAEPPRSARPGPGEVLIRVEDGGYEPLAAAAGRLVDEGERLAGLEGLAVSLRTEAPPAAFPGRVQGLDFAFEGVPPGRYRLVVYQFQSVVHQEAWFELAPGERAELGDVTTRPGGSIVVTPAALDGVTLDGAECFLDRVAFADYVQLVRRGDEFFADNVEDGRYRVWVVGPGLAHAQRFVELEAEREARVELPCEPGVDRAFVARAAKGTVWTKALFRLSDEAGRALLEYDHPMAATSNPLFWTPRLPPGRFALHVRTDTGLEARAEFDASNLEPWLGPLQLNLR